MAVTRILCWVLIFIVKLEDVFLLADQTEHFEDKLQEKCYNV